MARRKSTPAAAPEADLDVARKIWLAGVGAYGRMFLEAQGEITKLSGKANEMFDELVQRGQLVEHVVKERIGANEMAGKVVEAVERVQKLGEERTARLQARVDAVSKAVTDRLVPLAPNVQARQIEALISEVKALRADVDAMKRSPGAARRSPRVAAALAKTAAKAAPARRGRKPA